ncbi:exocyst complex component 3-like protein 2 isoform X2 [Rhinoraja longicauda]
MTVLQRIWRKAKSPTEGTGVEKKPLFKRRSSTEQEVPQGGPGGPEEGPASPGSGPGTEGPAEHEGRRRISFLRRGKGKAEPAVERATAEVGTAREPLSVLQILQLIKARELVLADGHIIELEGECERSGRESREHADGGRKAKDVALLYKELETEVAAIVRQSLAQPAATTHLGQLARTIEQEEKADRERDSRRREPGELRRRWRQAVKDSVSERLSAAQAGKDITIDQRLRSLGHQTVGDLISVRENIAVGYPREFEAFSLYVQSYHEAVSLSLLQIAQQDMDIQELYTFLQWTHCLYSSDVLGHEKLTAHISKQHLAPLLPADTLQTLEDNCVSMVKARITKDMGKALDVEQERWRQESKVFQSELANSVIKLLKEDIERSSAISEGLESRIAQCGLRCLADFLQSFQISVQELYGRFADSATRMECMVPQTIAAVNCCPAFRDYIERLIQKYSPDGEEMKRKMVGALEKVERGGISLLMEKLFSELKPHFAKLLRKKWLQSSESFESIVATIRDHFIQFHKMKTPPYQTLVDGAHRQVITQYLQPLMHRRVSCTSQEMRTRLALRLNEDSAKLQELFRGLSAMTWLDPAIGHVAEIIKLKETSSIQMEVGVLVSSYPDVRKHHISAVLDIRGDLSAPTKQLILECLQELDGQDGRPSLTRERGLFSEIDEATAIHCIGLGGHGTPGCLARWLHYFRHRANRAR